MDTGESAAAEGPASPLRDRASPYHIGRIRSHLVGVLVMLVALSVLMAFLHWPVALFAVPAGLCLIAVLAAPLMIGPIDRYLRRPRPRGWSVKVTGWGGRWATRVTTYGLACAAFPVLAASIRDGQWVSFDSYGAVLVVALAFVAVLFVISWLVNWVDGRLTVIVDERGIRLRTTRGWHGSVDFTDIVSALYRPEEATISLSLRPAQDSPPLDRTGDDRPRTIDLQNLNFTQRVRLFAALYDRVTWAADTKPPGRIARWWRRYRPPPAPAPVPQIEHPAESDTPRSTAPRLLGGSDPVFEDVRVR